MDAENAVNEQRTVDEAGSSKRGKRPGSEIVDDDDVDKEKPSEPKIRKQYSKVWEDFVVITKLNKSSGKSEERAMCKHCKHDYA